MPRFFIEQFGCRATQGPIGAALERQLLDRGCTSASTPAAADIIVVNNLHRHGLSRRAQARDAIRKLHAPTPPSALSSTGCYGPARSAEELAALPGVAWVVGNSHKPKSPASRRALNRRALRISKQFFSRPPPCILTRRPVPFLCRGAACCAPPWQDPHAATSSTAPNFSPPPSSAGKGITPAPRLRSRTAATLAAPTA